jgi:hypothetical protein
MFPQLWQFTDLGLLLLRRMNLVIVFSDGGQWVLMK